MQKSGLFGKILDEVLSESSYAERNAASSISFEDLDNSTRESTKDMATLWRIAVSGPNDEALKSIFLYGYKRDYTGSKGGNAYGPGLYCTWNLDSTIKNINRHSYYGDCITEMRLLGGYEGFVIFNEEIAKFTYENDWKIENQLMRISGISYQEAVDICRRINAFDNPDCYTGTTSWYAGSLWDVLGRELYTKYKAKGLVFHGDGDGDVVVVMDFSRVIPFAVSKDKGRTFQKWFNKDLYNNLIEHPDVESRYGGEYQAVFRAVKGFTMVRNRNDEYNVVNSRTDQLISPVWFDEVKGAIDPTDGSFGFTYRAYDFMGSIYSPEGSNADGCVLDTDGDPFCEFSELDELVDSIRQSGARNFQEFLQMISQNQQEDPQTNEGINRLVNERKQITPSQFISMVRQRYGVLPPEETEEIGESRRIIKRIVNEEVRKMFFNKKRK